MYKLRELSRQDMKIINSWRNNEDIVSTLGAPFRFINQEVDEKWFDAYMLNRTNTVRCAIITEQSDEILGLVSLTNIDFINSSAILHIMVGENAQNKGCGTFAVNEIVNHGFNNYGLHRIELHVLVDNKRAQHVYEKCGFVQEGIRRQGAFKNGQFKDVLFYSILNDKNGCTSTMGRNIDDGGGYCVSEVSNKSTQFFVIKSLDPQLCNSPNFAELFQKICNFGHFIVAYNAQILGYVVIYANDCVSKTAYITLLFVNEDYRNNKIGKVLLHYAGKVAAAAGMDKVRLEVNKKNIGAMRFYEREGYTYESETANSFYMLKSVESYLKK